jgi:peroxiredoxin
MSASKTPAPGDLAPDFSLPDRTGATVTLSGLTADSPCVIVFYRGHW